MKDFKIVDNFMPKEYNKRLSDIFLEKSFPWYITDRLSFTDDVAPSGDQRNWYKFSHVIYVDRQPNSNAYKEITPLIDAIAPTSLILARAFLTTYTGSKVNQGYHRDMFIEDKKLYPHIKNCVYYVNTNNGGTQFENGEFVESVANRALFFKAQKTHAAITADDVYARIVINFLYI